MSFHTQFFNAEEYNIIPLKLLSITWKIYSMTSVLEVGKASGGGEE